MGYLRGTYGVPMGFLWDPYEVPMGLLRGIYGSLWGPNGVYMGSLWGPYRTPMGHVWDPCGVPTGSLWVPMGSHPISLTVSGPEGSPLLGFGVSSVTPLLPTPRTRMSSTRTARSGMVNPNSVRYLWGQSPAGIPYGVGVP